MRRQDCASASGIVQFRLPVIGLVCAFVLVSGANIWIYRLLVLAISLEVVSMFWMWVHPSAYPLMM